MKKGASPKLVTIIVALAPVMIAACTTTSSPQPKNTNEASQPAPPKAEAPAPAPAAPPPSTAPVIASADGDAPGAKVEINEMKRSSGDTLTLRFSMVNGSNKDIVFNYNFVEQGKDVPDFNSIGGVHLIDPVGKKKILRRTRYGEPGLVQQGLERSETRRADKPLVEVFRRHRRDVQKISVVIPHFGPLDDVPISR